MNLKSAVFGRHLGDAARMHRQGRTCAMPHDAVLRKEIVPPVGTRVPSRWMTSLLLYLYLTCAD